MIAQIMLAGVYLLTRGRGYQLLEHPQIQRVLAPPPTASVTSMNSSEVIELFEGGWLELGECLPPARVIVARHPAPPPAEEPGCSRFHDFWAFLISGGVGVSRE